MGDIVIGWFQNTGNMAWLASILLTGSLVAQFFSKYSPKIRKVSRIVAHVLDLIEGILAAADDKQITKEEIELVLSMVKNLQEELK